MMRRALEVLGLVALWAVFSTTVLYFGVIGGCDNGTARAPEPPRPIEGMPGCTAQEVNYGGTRSVVLVRCRSCTPPLATQTTVGKALGSEVVLECPCCCWGSP